MKLIVTPPAAKALSRLPKPDGVALKAKLDAVAEDPTAPHGFVKGFGKNMYRARHGDYRAVYTIDRVRDAVVVRAIGNRKEIYR
jgi:mRNA-degrading endonuclease RelE of RelBE toxin-antitoxin system